MCIITATAVGTALGISTAATIGSTAATVAGTVAAIGNVALAVGAIGTVAGTTLGVVGNIQQGKAQQAQYNYQAAVDRENAKIANNNAGIERQAGLEEARRKRIQTLQAIGQQKAGLAANGVDVNYGTSLDIIEDTAELGELDALMLETEGERKAQNYEIQAMNFTNQANMNSFSARNARTAGTMNAWATGIKGVGDLGMKIGGGIFSGVSGLGSLGGDSDLLSGGSSILPKDVVSGGLLNA